MTIQPTDDGAAYLIVNADDFGYYRCISAGIAHAHSDGIVTATSVLSNYPRFREDLALLHERPKLDVGVHLNLTSGKPLSNTLAAKLHRNGGRFPSKLGLLKGLATGHIKPADVEAEWSMQVQACVDEGLKPCFLNSHEHMHMLPWLFPVAQRVAEQFSIRHLRLSAPDSVTLRDPAAAMRDIPLWFLQKRARTSLRWPAATFLGLGTSCRMTLNHVRDFLGKLEAGKVYELMCHPGFRDTAEIKDTRLLGYHDWEAETAALTDPSIPGLLDEHGVRLIGYREIEN